MVRGLLWVLLGAARVRRGSCATQLTKVRTRRRPPRPARLARTTSHPTFRDGLLLRAPRHAPTPRLRDVRQFEEPRKSDALLQQQSELARRRIFEARAERIDTRQRELDSDAAGKALDALQRKLAEAAVQAGVEPPAPPPARTPRSPIAPPHAAARTGSTPAHASQPGLLDSRA
jgi:hypothetical protein